MQNNKTLGFLKKRILDTLDENSENLPGEVLAGTDTAILIKKMPDCINASLSRMYESLPVKSVKAVMKLYKPEVICYRENIMGEGAVLEFDRKTKNAAVIFGYFGSGKVSFLDENSVVAGEIMLESKKGELEYLRQSFVFETEVVKAVFSQGLTVKDFTVYENKDNLDKDQIPPYGFASFFLPERVKKIESAVLDDGTRVEPFRVITANTAGYIRTSISGSVFLEYKKAPLMIDESADDSTVIELDGCAFEAAPPGSR